MLALSWDSRSKHHHIKVYSDSRIEPPTSCLEVRFTTTLTLLSFDADSAYLSGRRRVDKIK